jgi:AraC-like DNA-binding protein
MSMLARIRSFPLQNICLHHQHDYLQLVIATRGCAESEIAGRGGKEDVLNGYLIPTGDEHFYQGTGENQHLVLNRPPSAVEFGPQRVFDEPRYSGADANPRLLFAYLKREIETWKRQPGAAGHIVAGLLASVYERLLDRLCDTPKPRGRLDLAKLEAYIREHLDESLSTAALARVAHLSVRYFHSLFSEAGGTPPGRYVLRVRLKQAKRLLREAGQSVDVVAARVGFTSQSAFTHAFRRNFGHPPGHARRALAAGAPIDSGSFRVHQPYG